VGKCSLVCQDAADVGGDFPAVLFFRPSRYGNDAGVLVVFSVQITQLDLDGLLLFCADVSFAGLVSAALSSLQRLELRLDIWNIGPALAGSVGGGDWEFFDQRHPELSCMLKDWGWICDAACSGWSLFRILTVLTTLHVCTKFLPVHAKI
jgi:hypothetical protein